MAQFGVDANVSAYPFIRGKIQLLFHTREASKDTPVVIHTLCSSYTNLV